GRKGTEGRPCSAGTARTPRSHAAHTRTGVTRCPRTSDEQRPSPLDGNRSVPHVRSGRGPPSTELRPVRSPRHPPPEEAPVPNGPLTLPARLSLLAWATDPRVGAEPAPLPPPRPPAAPPALAR